MLENVSSAGIAGLTLWPEDLRHPFSVVPGEQILSPEDFAGLSVRATPSNLTYQMLEAFGASPMMGDTDYQAAESGLRQGFSLTGTPTATGNVVFFPKFQVLFANEAAFEKLSEPQQNILREAAIATQKKAITEHPSEVDAGSAWCTDGGTVVLASEAQVAAFEAAAQPVFASLEKDPLNAELIADIRELKANTKPSQGAQACSPVPLDPFDHGSIPPELVGTWSFHAFGEAWKAELTADGAFSLYGPDGTFDVGGSYGIFGDEAVFRDEIRGTGTLCVPAEGRYRWELTGDHLGFTVIEDQCTVGRIEQWTSGWQKVEEEWSTGLPPNGVWQVELSAEDIAKFDVLKSTAADMAGTYTWTFQDGNAKVQILGPQITVSCEAVATVVGDYVHIQYVGSPTCDGDAYDEVQWRLDTDGLHFHFIGSNDMAEVIRAEYEAKPWQKVEEWSQGLPPNGVWQVELSAEDFMQMDVLQSKANQMAGTYTWTLQDGNYVLLWEGGAGQSGNCIGTYAVMDDFVRLTSTTDDCPGEVEDFQWRLDDDGLHVHLLATKNIPFVEMKANFEAKPWQKIADP
jgi:hypothetical protein